MKLENLQRKNVAAMVRENYDKLRDPCDAGGLEKEKDFDAALWRLAGCITMTNLLNERLKTLEMLFEEATGMEREPPGGNSS